MIKLPIKFRKDDNLSGYSGLLKLGVEIIRENSNDFLILYKLTKDTSYLYNPIEDHICAFANIDQIKDFFKSNPYKVVNHGDIINKVYIKLPQEDKIQFIIPTFNESRILNSKPDVYIKYRNLYSEKDLLVIRNKFYTDYEFILYNLSLIDGHEVIGKYKR